MKKKKSVRFSAVLVIVCMMLLLLSACKGPEGGGEPSGEGASKGDSGAAVTLRVATMNPASDGKIGIVLQSYINYVERETDGAVKFELYPSDTACAAADAYTACQNGIVDISEYMCAFWGEDFPLWELFFMPFEYDFPDGNQWANAVCGMMEKYPEFEEEVTAKGVKLVGVHGDAANQIMMSKPLESAAGLKGKVLHVGTNNDRQMMEAMGVSCEMLVPTDVYDNLSKGVIDGLSSSYAGTVALGFAEELSYVMEINGFHQAWFMIMNQDAYNRIPAEYQYLFDYETTSKWTRLWGYQFASDEMHAKEEVQNDLQIVEASKEDMESLRTAASPVFEEWKKKVNDLGMDADEVYAYFKELVQNGKDCDTSGYRGELEELGVEVPDYYE